MTDDARREELFALLRRVLGELFGLGLDEDDVERLHRLLRYELAVGLRRREDVAWSLRDG